MSNPKKITAHFVISPRLNRKPILIFLESAQHRKVEADTAYQSVIDYRHNLLWVCTDTFYCLKWKDHLKNKNIRRTLAVLRV
ncbi:8914_t:CDS:2 [Entrophospora sp. SA101]|nr:10067_t:CDS:2 [Entrophospora sp. SA101]CAJ0904499.1 8914_t:CDS:2 [Entrophospora sp. SA101]